MKKTLHIWKIGGNVIGDPEALEQVLSAYARLPAPKLLVHGGAPQASTVSSQLGITPQLIAGRRVTDAATLELVIMVYAGLINKNLVAALQAKGVNALGLCGADADTIRSQKRAAQPIDFGFVGDIVSQDVPPNTLEALLVLGVSPVFCALTHDGQGQLLNTNSDTIAAHLAQVLCSQYLVKLTFCFDKPGVLLDPKDPQSLVLTLTYQKYIDLKKEGVIVDGMVPKLDNAFTALKKGVEDIHLCDWRGLSNTPMGGTTLCMS